MVWAEEEWRVDNLKKHCSLLEMNKWTHFKDFQKGFFEHQIIRGSLGYISGDNLKRIYLSQYGKNRLVMMYHEDMPDIPYLVRCERRRPWPNLDENDFVLDGLEGITPAVFHFDPYDDGRLVGFEWWYLGRQMTQEEFDAIRSPPT